MANDIVITKFNKDKIVISITEFINDEQLSRIMKKAKDEKSFVTTMSKDQAMYSLTNNLPYTNYK